MTPPSFRKGQRGGILNKVDFPRKRGKRGSVAISSRASTNPLM